MKNNIAIDPQNKGYLTYDEFYKNLSRIIKLSHPEAYVVYKQSLCPQKGLLSMKTLFKVLGGSWFCTNSYLNWFITYIIYNQLIKNGVGSNPGA